MKKIITITLNPSIDKSASVDNMVPEKKLICYNDKYEPGGGGINVARAITKLGGKATAIYLAGGHNGKFLTDLIKSENVESVFVECKNETRENFIIYDKSKKNQYRFGFPGSAILENEWKSLLEKVTSMDDIDFIVASGSVPQGISNNIFKEIAKLATQKNAKLIIDSSGIALQNCLQEKIFLWKPNLNELGIVAGLKDIAKEDVVTIAKEIIKKNQIEVIVVSLGAQGAIAVTKEDCFKITPPPTLTLSTVGAGDSMVGGIVWKLKNNCRLIEALQYGVACGTAATIHLGTELCNRKTADEIFKKTIVETLT